MTPAQPAVLTMPARASVPQDHAAAFSIHGSSGDYVGVVRLHSIDLLGRSGYVSIYTVPERRSQGYATSAVRLACSYAFDHLGLHRIGYTAFVTNAASLALAARCGFVEEGRHRGSRRLAGHDWVDEVQLGMLEEDWARLKVASRVGAASSRDNACS